jgi:hypothetical protein
MLRVKSSKPVVISAQVEVGILTVLIRIFCDFFVKQVLGVLTSYSFLLDGFA